MLVQFRNALVSAEIRQGEVHKSLFFGDGGCIDDATRAITDGLNGFKLPHGDECNGELSRDACVQIDAFFQLIHVVYKPDKAVYTFQGLAGIFIAVLCCG